MNLTTRLRLILICIVVVTISLPMVWVSLGKLVLFITSLGYIGTSLFSQSKDNQPDSLWSVRVILLSLIAFVLSITWSEVSTDMALNAFIKHSKLLEIVMLVLLIQNNRDARIALFAFFASQGFFISSSWIMASGFRVPWASSDLIPQYKSIVYSTYLDQTLIFSAAAAIFWHLRQQWNRNVWLAVILAVAAIANNLFLQEGKTGYVAALTILTLALMWEIPKKWRLMVLVFAPIVVGITLYSLSAKFQQRVIQMFEESQNYDTQNGNASSSGFRLHAWHRSLQAIAQEPLIGHGVGSWTQSVKRIEGTDAIKVFGEGLTSNPHQEFLLWGVELGLGGTLLLMLLVAALVRDAMQFETPLQRALISVVAVMVVGCMFNSSLYDALIGDFFCVTLGLLLALGVRHQSPACLPDTPAPQKVNA